MENEKLARTIKGEITQATGDEATVSVRDSIAELSGRSGSLQNAVDAGHIAAGSEQVRQVVNEIDYPGKIPVVLPSKVSDELTGREFDVVIIGGGVIGLAIARELSRFDLRIASLRGIMTWEWTRRHTATP